MWNIIFVVVATLLLIGVVLIVNKSSKQFRDKSLKVKKDMGEEEVREVMESDPVSIEYLEDDEYEWIYERKYYKGWGMVTVKTEIIFTSEKKVKTIHRSETLDKEKEE